MPCTFLSSSFPPQGAALSLVQVMLLPCLWCSPLSPVFACVILLEAASSAARGHSCSCAEPSPGPSVLSLSHPPGPPCWSLPCRPLHLCPWVLTVTCVLQPSPCPTSFSIFDTLLHDLQGSAALACLWASLPLGPETVVFPWGPDLTGAACSSPSTLRCLRPTHEAECS